VELPLVAVEFAMAEVAVRAEVVEVAKPVALVVAVAMLLKLEHLLRKTRLGLVTLNAHLLSLENLINTL
jgi:hypothetical protein